MKRSVAYIIYTTNAPFLAFLFELFLNYKINSTLATLLCTSLYVFKNRNNTFVVFQKVGIYSNTYLSSSIFVASVYNNEDKNYTERIIILMWLCCDLE